MDDHRDTDSYSPVRRAEEISNRYQSLLEDIKAVDPPTAGVLLSKFENQPHPLQAVPEDRDS